MADAFPFPYLGHGVLALDGVGKASGAYLAFERPVPEEDRAAVMQGCPAPINGIWAWGPTLVSCESLGDTFDWTLASTYGVGDPDSIDAETLAAFAADVETWVRGVHALHPLVFFIGPVGAAAPSAWGEDSARVLPAIAIPFLEIYAAENVADLVEDDEAAEVDDDEGEDPEAGIFDAIAMSCLLEELPEPADRDLAKRLERLRTKFGLGPKGAILSP